MSRRPPRSTRTDTLFPYTTLFRSVMAEALQPGGTGAGRGIDLDAVFGLQHLAVFLHQILCHAAAELLRNCRSEEHTSELQSLMRSSYAVFCLKTKKLITPHITTTHCTHNTSNPPHEDNTQEP